MTTLNDAELAILRSGHQNLAFFFRAEFASGTVRMFAGAGDYPIEADAVETEGGIYTSAGIFAGGLPDIDHLINGQIQGLRLSLSGVDAEVVRNYMATRSEVIGAPAALGWAVLDNRFKPAGPVRWPARGGLFQPRVARQRTEEGRWSRVISVTLMVGPYGRRVPRHRFYSKADHRRDHPTDAFCDLTGSLTAESTRAWPD